MVQLFFKSEFDRCSFKKRVNKKIIVRSCLLEDLVCIPTEQTITNRKNIPSHSFFVQEMVVNCYSFVALVS